MDVALWVAVIGGFFSLLVLFVTKQLESRSANTAILAEIRRLLKVLGSHKRWWEECVLSGETGLPLVSFTTPVFDERVKTIGEIDRRMVADVVAFYGYVKFINGIQSQQSKYADAGMEHRFNEQYVRMLGSVMGNFERKFDAAFSKYGLM
jgi:hypothetical protein